MLSVMRAGRALAYLRPRSESGESPPIFPSTLYWLSPCYMVFVSTGTQSKFRSDTNP